MTEFGTKLSDLLTENQMTRKELAKILNITPTSLTRYIKGDREPDFQLLCAAARFFKVSAGYLLGLEDELGTMIVDGSLTADEQRLVEYYRSLPRDLKQISINNIQTLHEFYIKAKKADNYR